MVEARVGAGDVHGAHVDVGCEHARAQNFCRGDGEDAAAGAEIENVARFFSLHQFIDRQQAAACRAVMAGAEGERGLDFDSDAMCRHARAIVRAMHDELPGMDRSKCRRDSPRPNRVALVLSTPERPHVFCRRCGNHCAQRRHIEWSDEMHFDLPAADEVSKAAQTAVAGSRVSVSRSEMRRASRSEAGRRATKVAAAGSRCKPRGPLMKAGYPDDIDKSFARPLSRSYPGARPQEHWLLFHSFSGCDLWIYTQVSTCSRRDGTPPNALCRVLAVRGRFSRRRFP